MELNRREKDRVICLLRRINWLTLRVQQKTAEKTYDFDARELSALKWIIGKVLSEEEIKSIEAEFLELETRKLSRQNP